jgi:hypothetical protein
MSDQRQNSANDPSDGGEARIYCAMRERPARVFEPGVTGERERLIALMDNKWVGGTVLRYYFFDDKADGQSILLADGQAVWRSWVGTEAQKDVVRRGFQTWSGVGIGIQFQEVSRREEAEIRIGFMRGDGAWSWLGRDILKHGPNERTMNFGWDLTGKWGLDTAIHEIGHTLGFPHEHQNPNAGIEWDEEAVYAALAQPPNEWTREQTFWNILRKIPVHEVRGTTWDPDSIMHYPFEKGLIRKPERYSNGLRPAGGLSAKDKALARELYPALPHEDAQELRPSHSVLLNASAGKQRSFTFTPSETRHYHFQTFGASDTVMILFEDQDGELRYRAGDDDSGQAANAHFRIKLINGRRYVLQMRVYYSERPSETAVMMW